MEKAVHAASTPVIVAFGRGVVIPVQGQVADVHGLPMGFNAPSALHLRDVRRGDCASGGVLFKGPNAFVDGSYGFVYLYSSLLEACYGREVLWRLALVCKGSLNSSSLALVLLYL